MTTEPKAKKERKKATKKQKAIGCLAWAVAIPLMIVACNSGGSDEKPKDTPTAKVEAKAEQAKPHVGEDDKVDWKSHVMKIYLNESLHGGKSGQIDQIMIYAKDFDLSDSVIKSFETEIVKNYQSKKYLTNDAAALEHLFMATVVEKHYDDKLQKPIDKFAFDYLQNIKDSYRGINDSIAANEAQMNKSLSEIK
ncbi:hypothetical protein ACIFOT_07010 [Neobacillus sp. NRS-1170]|uniref:hypothetical protein n=1 Tax=Neobacillus sp. NRS-1170 TaxID=3233898 RepID=UPI003D2C5A33